jgi:hypothetical protein
MGKNKFELKSLNMKTIYSLLFMLAFACTVHAQPVEYNGPAKIVVKQIQDGLTKLEKSVAGGGSSMDIDFLSNMVRKITELKKRDATYNTAEMESRLVKIAEGIEAIRKKTEVAKQQSANNIENMQKASKLIYALFHDSPQVDDADLSTIEEQISKYNQKLTELLSMDRTLNKEELQASYNQLKRSAQVAEKDLNGIDYRCRQQTNPKNAEVEYYELKYNQAYWNAAQKVFPDELDFKKAYVYAGKLLDGLGSVENVHQLANKTMANKVSNTQLPSPVMKDAALEKSFIEIFNKYHGEKLGATAIKAVLLNDDWIILRNEVSGIVTGRRRSAAIAYKKKDGKCYYFSSFSIEQEYVGGSFGSSKSSNLIYGGNEILCENVK